MDSRWRECGRGEREREIMGKGKEGKRGGTREKVEHSFISFLLVQWLFSKPLIFTILNEGRISPRAVFELAHKPEGSLAGLAEESVDEFFARRYNSEVRDASLLGLSGQDVIL